MSVRDDLHQMVDALPDREVAAVRRVLVALLAQTPDPLLQAVLASLGDEGQAVATAVESAAELAAEPADEPGATSPALEDTPQGRP